MMTDTNNATATNYSKPLSMPMTTQEGLANAIQMAINQIEAGDSREAVYTLVNLLDDVASKSNPYNIGRVARKAKPNNYRGTVNVD
jgi:hypothetical protein